MEVITARIVISAYAFNPNSDQKEIAIQIEAYLDADMAKTEVEALANTTVIEAELLKIGARVNRLSHACTDLFSDGALITFGARVPWNGEGSFPIIDSFFLNLLTIGLANFYGVGASITWSIFEYNLANVSFARRGVQLPIPRTFPENRLWRRKEEGEQHLFIPRVSIMFDSRRVNRKNQDKTFFEWKYSIEESEDKKGGEDKQASPSAKRARGASSV